MKRGKRAVKKRGVKKKVKKSVRYGGEKFARKLVATVLIIIFFLLLARGIFFVLEKIAGPVEVEEVEVEGELPVLKWYPEDTDIILDVLNYSLINDNQTVIVNINWSSGTGPLDAILIVFNRSEGVCNYTQTTDLNISLGENKTYEINSSDTNCGPTNFSNLINVLATAGINITISQIQNFNNISLYKNENATDIIDLDDYFECTINDLQFLLAGPVVDCSYNTTITLNTTTNQISIYQNPWCPGEQQISVTAGCGSETKADGFYLIILNQTRPPVNNPPEFDEDDCDEFVWEVDHNYTIDMDYCFEDPEDDNLEFRYTVLHEYEDNISIIKLNGNRLKFVPNQSFIGKTYFYIYANDSVNPEVRSEKIYIWIVSSIGDGNGGGGNGNGGGDGDGNASNATDVPEIKSSSPTSEDINVSFNESLDFSVDAENYDSIKWYLDGREVKSGVESYTASSLSEGEYIVKVEVKKGDKVKSKIWNLSVFREEAPKSRLVYLIIICVVLGILILIVVLIIVKNIIERKEEARATPEIRGKAKPGSRRGYVPPVHYSVR